jgi:hypothetical protein
MLQELLQPKSNPRRLQGLRCGFGLGLSSMTGRDLKFHQRHPLQRRWVSLAFPGSAKDGFSDRLHMRRSDRVWQRRNRRAQDIFHDAYGLRWKRCVRKVFHHLGQILESNVAAINAVKSFRQANKIWRQLVWTGQSGTQPFTDLCADCAAIDAIDLNTVWILAHHEMGLCCNVRPTAHSRSGESFLAQTCWSCRRSSAGPFSNSESVGADTNAHTGSPETDTSARRFVVTPTLDITLARSVSV